MQTFKAAQDFSYKTAFVSAGVVPYQDDRASQMPEQVAQKMADLCLLDVLFVQGIYSTDQNVFSLG